MAQQRNRRARRIVAANDNAPGARRVTVRGLHAGLSIQEIEVEIFDALISNIAELTANDNGPPDG